MLQALECLLGGKAAQAPAERHLTEIDWVLTRGVLDAIVRQLSVAWDELGGPELTRGEVDIEGDAGVLAPIGEPTLRRSRSRSRSTGSPRLMSLLIPWAAIEPIASSIRGAGGEPRSADRAGRRGASPRPRRRAGAAARRGRLGADADRADARRSRPALCSSSRTRAEDGVLLFAEGVSLGRGRPGRSGARRALKLDLHRRATRPRRTYAKLGRSELERARAHRAAGARRRPRAATILRSIFVRVWAELGRTHLPLGRALELAQGAVVELDQAADAPVELFANGLCFANGSLSSPARAPGACSRRAA